MSTEERLPILQSEYGLFRNAEEFIKLQAQKRLLPGQIIRVHNYSARSGDERLYVVGPDNKLYAPEQETPVNPLEVLAGEPAEDGWEFSGRDPNLLPESKLKELLEIQEVVEFPEPKPDPSIQIAED